MSRELILKDFESGGKVSGTGEFAANAGKFSRHAIVAAFELNGSLEAFAEWAKNNQTDFYTKLFPRLITREMTDPVNKGDDVEELLEIIDVDAEEIIAPSKDDTGETRAAAIDPFLQRHLAEAAEEYARGEDEYLEEDA